MSTFASLISSYQKEDAGQSGANSSQLSNGTIQASGEASGCAEQDGKLSGLILSEDGRVGCFSHRQLDLLPHKVQLSESAPGWLCTCSDRISYLQMGYAVVAGLQNPFRIAAYTNFSANYTHSEDIVLVDVTDLLAN